MKCASRLSKSVIVAFSGGKDSVVTLDLCHRYFEQVHAFFMYFVPGLSFQEAILRHYEAKYGITIHRIPHPQVSEYFRKGFFVKEDLSVPSIGMNDIYNTVRLRFDAWWIAAGERIADSTIRRAMIKKSSSIDRQRGRIYPVAHFKKADILRYVLEHKLKIAPETRVLGHSFRSLLPDEIPKIKQHYPEDYERIRAVFPFVEASVMRAKMDAADKATKEAA